MATKSNYRKINWPEVVTSSKSGPKLYKLKNGFADVRCVSFGSVATDSKQTRRVALGHMTFSYIFLSLRESTLMIFPCLCRI